MVPAVIRNNVGLLRCREGTAAVEFAIVTPLLLLLLFGGIEVGRLLTDFHAVSKSVRDASRFLARVEMTCPSASSGPVSDYLVNAGDETTAKNLVLSGTVDTPVSDEDYLLKYWKDPSTVSATVICIANAGVYQGAFAEKSFIPQITVTANVPFAFLWGTLFLDQPSLTMSVKNSQINVGE